MPLHSVEPHRLIELIVQHAPIGIAVIDSDGRYRDANPSYCEIYGYEREALLGQLFTLIVEPSARANVFLRHQQFLQGEGTLNGEWETQHRDGSRRYVIAESVVIASEQGAKMRLVYVVDATQRKQTDNKLHESEQLFRTLAGIAPVGIFRTDAQGNCIYVNDRWRDIAGLTSAQASGAGWLDAIHTDDRAHVMARWYSAAQKGTAFSDEYRFVDQGGHITWVIGRAMAERNAAGDILGYVGTITDITDRKSFEVELVALATTDFLTGLANRRSFIGSLEKEVARLRRHPTLPVSLLMLDLDHFKNINDNYGHAVGDALLRHFTNTINTELRAVDLAGRLGGEEFGIILPGAGLQEAKVFAERLCKHIAEAPLQIDGRTIFYTASIGVAALRRSDTHSDVLLSRADKALYAAKNCGRNRVGLET